LRIRPSKCHARLADDGKNHQRDEQFGGTASTSCGAPNELLKRLLTGAAMPRGALGLQVGKLLLGRDVGPSGS